MEKDQHAQLYFGVSEERLLLCLIHWAKKKHFVEPHLIEMALDSYESIGYIPKSQYDGLELFILKYDIEIK